MTVTEDQVREELKKVIDPELFVNIVDLGLVYVIEVQPLERGPTESANHQASPGDDADSGGPSSHAPAVGQTPSSPTCDSNSAADAGPPATADAAPEPGVEACVAVKIEMTMTSPMCPAGPQLVGQSRQFVGRLPGVSDVEIKIVMDPPWTPDRMTEEARDQLGIF